MSAPAPNIVLCMCDQMRAFEVGCYGHPVVRTPNLDRLAARGARFDVAITNNPVCTPARSTVLTGQYSRTCCGETGNCHTNPPNDKRERMFDPTLAEVCRDHGYRTALVGKWHIDPQPQLVGFDTALYPCFQHKYYDQVYYNEQAEPFTVNEFGGAWEAERVRAFLREAGETPFFLFYNISPPHQPIGPGHLPERYTRMYSREDVKLRANAVLDGEPAHSKHWFNVYTSSAYWWRHCKKEEQDPADIVDDSFDLVDLTRLYYGAITCVDDLVGQLLAGLEREGLAENTIVVFVSDHGDNLGSHGLFNKNSLIDESLRIPLLIVDPRGPGPVVNRTQVASMVDVMPSVLELAGLPVPEAVQGRSLAPLVGGDKTALSGENAAYVETGAMIGVRTPTHLYGIGHDRETRSVVDEDRWFYNLVDDPEEMENQAGTGREADIEEELRAALLAWDRQTPWLEAPPYAFGL